MNGAREKEKDRMDRGAFCSKRYVSIREKRWVIRDLRIVTEADNPFQLQGATEKQS